MENPETTSLLSEADNTPETSPTTESGQDSSHATWTTQIRKDVRDDIGTQLDSFKDVTEFAKHSVDAIGELKDWKEKAIMMPTETATEDELKAYRSKIGVPESASKYNLEKSGLNEEDKEVVDKFREAAFNANLSSEQAEKMATMMSELSKQAIGSLDNMMAERKAESEKELKTLWKDDYSKNLKQVSRMVKEHGGEEFLEALGKSGFANEKSFIVPMFELSKKFSEPSFHEAGGGGKPKTDGLVFPNTTYPNVTRR